MGRILGLIVALSALPLLSATAQQTGVPLRDLVAAAGEQIASQCVRLLDAPAAANELAQRANEMSKSVFCDCMPPAIEGLKRGRALETPMGTEDFSALVMREFDVCGAQAVRETTHRDCAKFTPPNAPPTYCACFAASVDALTDQQIVEDSIASRDNLEQRRDARNNSAPEPPLYEGLMARIDRQCQLPPSAQ